MMDGVTLEETTLVRTRDELERHRDLLRAEIRAQGLDPDSDDVTFVDDSGFADKRCGLPISIERLEALPWATLCKDCKQRGNVR